MTMNYKEIVDCIKEKDLENQLYISAKYLLGNKDFELSIKGMSSYIDGKEIVIGLPYDLIEISNEEELYIFLMAAMGNQVQRILSSPKDEIGRTQKKTFKYMRKKRISGQVAENISYSILNSLEDGRVENILVNNKKGFSKYVKYARYKYYVSTRLEKDELYDFLNSIYIYGTTGLLPIGFGEMYAGTRLGYEFYKIKEDIDKAVHLKSCRQCMDIAEKIGEKISDYVKDLVGEEEEIDEDKIMQKKTSPKKMEEKFNPNNENDTKIDNMMENEDLDDVENNETNMEEEIRENTSKNIEQNKTMAKRDVEIENYYLGKGAAPNSSIEIKRIDDGEEKINGKVELPLDIKKRAKKFNREIIEIMEERKKPLRRNQKSGIIDTNNLYRFDIFDDTDIFIKNAKANEIDTVFYFLVDGSGSMKENNKWEYAIETMAVLEEALKQIVKIKVVVFNTSWKNTEHIIIKDFDDNTKNTNLIYTSYKNKYIIAGGANKDGANIRIASKELEKRDEKQKILFVLSDGMPSAYQYNGQFAIDDVKNAVKEVRDKNMEVISIMFGSRDFRKEYYNVYKEMYEKNIISAEPSEIFEKVIKVLKDIFLNSN
ncbi:VWA domain-containing protein [Anaerosalibacter bizertensis]|uniref:VWA domain-containing protein n=1 Tax=Anaerosalibacter bizertensis TaxID=932217 RepID=A0A9Q4AB52_9FIRM|nr:VWA domain-containing protein [Anaerosalibacter bizertensis]MBV1817776.1 VWA domain-containing protein [Bacteroidales bacterium MSK.15.36]MCB5559037.1 VWA domain-containing protein [Anaerosalibacter bizertensis]MCG4564303.1 VWA domain-containing protein [Anaerosalibacter bizertensis]MCG4581484.1 VWA domain-containing protein [Anaerosalibacter bizertensis]